MLRLAHVLGPGHPVHQGMTYFGERLSALSGGTMKVNIYASGQLGNERECLELLQLGALDMAKVSSSVIENFVPEMAVFSLSYLFDNFDTQIIGYAMKTDQYRCIEWKHTKSDEVKARELYDHEIDPQENVNVIDDTRHAETVKEMEQMMMRGRQAALPENNSILSGSK